MHLASHIFHLLHKHKINLKAKTIGHCLENISECPWYLHKFVLFLHLPHQLQISMLMHQPNSREFSLMMTLFTFQNGLVGSKMREKDGLLEVVLKDKVYLKYVGLCQIETTKVRTAHLEQE